MKIIGNTMGMGLPKPNLMQTDPTKGDYVKGKEQFLEQVVGGTGSSIFYSSLSFEYNAGTMLHFFQCDKQEIRKNGRNIQVGDLIIFGNLSLGIVEKVTDTQVSGSLYASLKGEPGSGGGLDVTIDGETLVFAESSTATIENETLIL